MKARLRRGASGVGASAALPVTTNDVVKAGSRRHQRRRPDISFSPYDRTSLIRWVALVVVSMSIALFIWKPVLSVLGLGANETATGAPRRLSPLSQFSDLAYALKHSSDLVLLYYAASWCPMSTPVSVALDKAFGRSDQVLTPNGAAASLAIVYVSSDRTKEEYEGYLQGRNWLAIPYESGERNELKRHFSVCAHRELEEIGIDRKHEIPTIIVIDSQTEGVITTNGAEDLSEMGAGALEHWKEMQSWVRKQTKNAALLSLGNTT